jgi:hypothetical protein
MLNEVTEAHLACAHLAHERGHDQRRRQERHDPHNIVRRIDSEIEEWPREKVIKTASGQDR